MKDIHLTDKITLTASGIAIALLVLATLIFEVRHAQNWVELAKNRSLVMFYDPGAILKRDGSLSVQILIDYNKKQENPLGEFLSVVDYLNISCADKAYSSQKRLLYPGKMASGSSPVEDARPTESRSVPDFLGPIVQGYCS